MTRRSQRVAVQYLRASTGLQDQSVAQQATFIAIYARQRGYKIVETFADDGISGLTLSNRPAMQRLLAAALAPNRTFDAILVYDVSRWGRFQDVDQGAHYEFLCRSTGVSLVYCAEPFDNDGSPEAELIKQLKRAFAAEFSRGVSQRVWTAQRFVAGRGFRAAGYAPFGYQRELFDRRGRSLGVWTEGLKPAGCRARLTPGPPEAVATVRAAFQWFTDGGMSSAEIADRLNAEGAPRPGNTPWSSSSVRLLLRRETYLGVYNFGRKHRPLGGKPAPAPKANWIRREGAIPSLISRRVFESAQARLTDSGRRSEAAMAEDLKRLLARHGHLNMALIDEASDTLKAQAYARRFGSMRAAYAEAGYDPGPRRGLRGPKQS